MAKTVGTLAYQIVADTKDFTNGMVATRKELRAASQIIEAMKSPVDKLAEAEQALTTLYQKRALTLDQYTSALHDVRQEHKALTAEVASEATVLEKQQSMFTRMVPVIDPVDIALRTLTKAWELASAAAEFLTGKIVDQLAEIDAMGNAAQSLGVSFNEFATLKHLAVDADVEIETLTKAFGKMEQAIVKAGQDKKLRQLFTDIGLSVDDLRKMSPAEAFGKIGDAIGKIDDPMASLAVNMRIFGKSGIEIARLMGTTSEAMAEAADEARKYGLTIDELALRNINELDNAWNEVGERMTGVWRIATVQLAPALLDIVNELNRMLASGDQEGLRALFTDLASAIRLTAEATKGMASALASMAEKGGWLFDVADKLGMNPLSTAQQAATAFGAASGEAALARHMREMAKPINTTARGGGPQLGLAEQLEEEAKAAEEWAQAMQDAASGGKDHAESQDMAREAISGAAREIERLQKTLLEMRVGKDTALINDLLFGQGATDAEIDQIQKLMGDIESLKIQGNLSKAFEDFRSKSRPIGAAAEIQDRFVAPMLKGSQEAIKLLAGRGEGKLQEQMAESLKRIDENTRRDAIEINEIDKIA